jgi:hypothetical protein
MKILEIFVEEGGICKLKKKFVVKCVNFVFLVKRGLYLTIKNVIFAGKQLLSGSDFAGICFLPETEFYH